MITVTATIRDRDGDPDPNGKIAFQLFGTLIDEGRVVLPYREVFDADANGQVSVDLWPNVGPEESSYLIQVFSDGQEMLNARLSLTASGDLEDLL